jgi:hypothetical protein
MTAADPSSSRRWLILAVVGVAQVMVVLDTTVVNIALPQARRALHFSNGDRHWSLAPTRWRSGAYFRSAGGSATCSAGSPRS